MNNIIEINMTETPKVVKTEFFGSDVFYQLSLTNVSVAVPKGFSAGIVLNGEVIGTMYDTGGVSSSDFLSAHLQDLVWGLAISYYGHSHFNLCDFLEELLKETAEASLRNRLVTWSIPLKNIK